MMETKIRAIAGSQFKLTTQGGTILGVVTIPLHWAEILAERRSVQFSIQPEVRYCRLEDNDVNFTIRTGALTLAYKPRDALILWGISLEEFEKLPNCTFTPSAAYLRSVVD